MEWGMPEEERDFVDLGMVGLVVVVWKTTSRAVVVLRGGYVDKDKRAYVWVWIGRHG
jgi:hypothetical protein